MSTTQSLSNKDKISVQNAGLEIEKFVAEGLTYLEAISRYVDENNIPEGLIKKLVPSVIIDKLAAEAREENYLRPSATDSPNNLDFLC